MGLFGFGKKKDGQETEEQIAKRLAKYAPGIVNMMIDVLKNQEGKTDMTTVLIYAAGMAGYACQMAVRENGEELVKVSTADGKNYYYGDAINKYLLESKLSVFSFINAVTKIKSEEVQPIIVRVAQTLGSDQFNMLGQNPDTWFKGIKGCWNGIYENVTTNFCQSPSEWPVLFGIVTQNAILRSIQVGAPDKEAGLMAMEVAIVMSKME